MVYNKFLQNNFPRTKEFYTHAREIQKIMNSAVDTINNFESVRKSMTRSDFNKLMKEKECEELKWEYSDALSTLSNYFQFIDGFNKKEQTEKLREYLNEILIISDHELHILDKE